MGFGPAGAVSSGFVTVGFGLGLWAGDVVGTDIVGAVDVVAMVDVVLDGAPLLAALAVDRVLVLAALTLLWESPPQAPSPTAATTTSAVTWRMVDVPTACMYGSPAHGDCRESVQSSIE